MSFLSFCLQSTLKNIAHAHASGLTPRSIIGKFKSIGMIDVHIPTSDGRELVLTRHVEPDRDVSLLLEQLDLKLPEQPPPRISAM